ncbi:RhoGEF4, partial [Caligus rogercresseyi]
FYSTYANDFASNVKLVERLTEENKEFRRALGLKLNSLLITPIQRIPRYKLLLEDLLKNTSPNHPDRTDLTKALLEIEGTLDIQKSLLRGLPKILKPGRTLLKTGLLMK